MSIEEAFFGVCEEAKPAEPQIVSLYEHSRPYGGPEEGGWWRDWYTLKAYQVFPTEEQAEAAKARIDVLAEELTAEAMVTHNEHCAAQMDWLEARGLDSDYLPEVDAYTTYYVITEDRPGANESHDTSGYS